jgi:hypothetical protein
VAFASGRTKALAALRSQMTGVWRFRPHPENSTSSAKPYLLRRMVRIIIGTPIQWLSSLGQMIGRQTVRANERLKAKPGYAGGASQRSATVRLSHCVICIADYNMSIQRTDSWTYTNEYGEQWILEYDPLTGEGTLNGSDIRRCISLRMHQRAIFTSKCCAEATALLRKLSQRLILTGRAIRLLKVRYLGWY